MEIITASYTKLNYSRPSVICTDTKTRDWCRTINWRTEIIVRQCAPSIRWPCAQHCRFHVFTATETIQVYTNMVCVKSAINKINAIEKLMPQQLYIKFFFNNLFFSQNINEFCCMLVRLVCFMLLFFRCDVQCCLREILEKLQFENNPSKSIR